MEAYTYTAYDYSKLRGRTAELGLTNKAVAAAAGITAATYSLKLNNRGEFSQGEICRIMRFLQLNLDEVWRYFFTEKV